MSVRHALLGLLLAGPSHGYDLKHLYDDALSPEKPLPAGQVYSTLGRLERDDLVSLTGLAQGDGPDRKIYAITDSGTDAVADWLLTPEHPEPQLQATLYMKVVLTLLSGRPIEEMFDTQRAAHLAQMRTLTALRRTAEPAEALLADYALFHLEADLRWLELTSARVADINQKLSSLKGDS